MVAARIFIALLSFFQTFPFLLFLALVARHANRSELRVGIGEMAADVMLNGGRTAVLYQDLAILQHKKLPHVTI